MFRYNTISDFDLKGKIVGIRVDINSPIIGNKVVLNERIIEHSKTIDKLSKLGAKVVILAHQGRKGQDDCISLKEHSKLISNQIKREIDFIDEIYSKKVEEKILNLKNSEILLLENLRFYEDEENLNLKNNKILLLEKLFDFYVFDAFSVAHRKQTSVIGLINIPNIAGLVMAKEIEGLNKIDEIEKKPRVYAFGGAKPDDIVVLMEKALKDNSVELILLSGVIGEIALMISGYKLGKKEQFLKEKGFLNSFDKIKELIKKYPNKIEMPKDVAIFTNNKRIEILVKDLDKNLELINENLIEDIGTDTTNYYKLLISNASSIYFKGPCGNFEKKGFEIGTENLLNYITSTNAFTYMGGGHSVTSAAQFKVLKKFSYVSLAGGALIKFISKEKLPAIESLERSFHKYEKLYEDFVVVGSNVEDIEIRVPRNLNDIKLGDKVIINENFKNSIGGGGINTSIGLSRLGAKVGYLGKISYENKNTIIEYLKKNKVNLIDSKISKKTAAKSIILDVLDSDRVIFTYRGQNAFLEKTDFNLNSFKTKNFLFTSLMGSSFETINYMAKEIKKNDSNSNLAFIPSIALMKENLRRIKNFLKYIDIIILNYEEAQELTSKNSINDCLKELKKYNFQAIVLTDGANGSYGFDKNQEYHQKSIKTKVIDTTGAGDCFSGTFYYFFSKGFGMKKSLKLAALNASSVVSKKGANDGLLYYEELLLKLTENS